MTDARLLKKIIIDPLTLTGKPVIKGTRLSVDFILNLLAHGTSEKEIIQEYKGLTSDDIKSCILFAAKSLENNSYLPLPKKV